MSRDAHADLAQSIRRLLAELHRTELTRADAAELTAALDRLRSTLAGPERRRWYERGSDVSPADKVTQWRDWSLFRGEHQALAPPLRMERTSDEHGPLLRGAVVCGPMYEGPPGAVHGGYVAGLFDDILGACLSLVGGPSGVTGRLTVRYRRPTPLGVPLVLEARPTDVRARRMLAEAVLFVDGVPTAEAEALFLRRSLGPADPSGHPPGSEASPSSLYD